MRTKQLAAMMVIGMALVQGAAYAETITGKIVSVDANAMRLVVNQKIHATGKTVEKAFSVNPKATFRGFAALGDLKPGQKVKVEEEENSKTHAKEAVSVSLENTGKEAHRASDMKPASTPKP